MSDPVGETPQNNSGAKFATGCGIGCLAVALIAGIGIFIGFKSVQLKVDAFAAKASSEPIAFQYPQVQLHEAEAVLNRFEDFREAMANSEPTPPLLLSQDDLNILIEHHQDLAPIGGKILCAIADNNLNISGSMKPEDFPVKIPFISKAFAGKHINGSITLNIAIIKGQTNAELLDFQFAGTTIPEEILPRISEEFMTDLDQDEDFGKFVDQIDVLKIEGNVIHIIPKQVPPTP